MAGGSRLATCRHDGIPYRLRRRAGSGGALTLPTPPRGDIATAEPVQVLGTGHRSAACRCLDAMSGIVLSELPAANRVTQSSETIRRCRSTRLAVRFDVHHFVEDVYAARSRARLREKRTDRKQTRVVRHGRDVTGQKSGVRGKKTERPDQGAHRALLATLSCARQAHFRAKKTSDRRRTRTAIHNTFAHLSAVRTHRNGQRWQRTARGPHLSRGGSTEPMRRSCKPIGSLGVPRDGGVCVSGG
jgi:hypothetical protein